MRIGLRRMSGMRRNLILAVGLLMLATGCGAGASTLAERTTTAAPAQDAPLYEVNTTVLEQTEEMAGGAHGPALCLGGVAASYPPQCGDVPISNWDWDAVEGEESSSGTTWGVFHVVGAFDGTTFTVTEAGPVEPSGEAAEELDFSPACPEPAGGWVIPDPDRATDEQAGNANAYAVDQPDYVSSWVDYLEEPTEEKEALGTLGPVIYSAIFTGDAKRHEAEIRKVFGGPLCVVVDDVPTERELSRIRTEAEGDLEEMGVDHGGIDPRPGDRHRRRPGQRRRGPGGLRRALRPRCSPPQVRAPARRGVTRAPICGVLGT